MLATTLGDVWVLQACHRAQGLVIQAAAPSTVSCASPSWRSTSSTLQIHSGSLPNTSRCLQAHGVQHSLRLCPRHISPEDAPDQHGPQADQADVASLQRPAQEVGWQGLPAELCYALTVGWLQTQALGEGWAKPASVKRVVRGSRAHWQQQRLTKGSPAQHVGWQGQMHACAILEGSC